MVSRGTCWEAWLWSRNETSFDRWRWCLSWWYQKERWNGHFVGCKGKYCRWILYEAEVARIDECC